MVVMFNFATFKSILPKAGFIWEEGPEVLSSGRRDQIVANRLRAVVDRFDRNQTEPHLAQIFTRGAVIARVHATLDGPAFRLRLRRFVPFASGSVASGGRPGLSDKVWKELVKALLAARAAWHAAPRCPFNVGEHGALAHAIDEYNAATAGKFTEVVSADGLTLEDLAGEDAGDSNDEGEDGEDGRVRTPLSISPPEVLYLLAKAISKRCQHFSDKNATMGQ